MAKHKVLRALEHDLKLYVPKGCWPDRAVKAKSVANGQDIEVDDSGVIELSEKAAAALPAGVVLLKEEEAPKGKSK